MSEGNFLDEAREYFEDDSRTFRDGPLLNYFRLRKWFIVVAVLLTLFDNQWIAYARLAPALFLDQLPVLEVRRWLTFFGIYLVIHAVFLLYQLLLVYGEDVTERARLHGEAAIRKAQLAVQERKKSMPKAPVSDEEEETPYHPDAKKALSRAQDDLDRLVARYEETRGRIRATEVWRDGLRIFPVLLLLGWAMYWHGTWQHLLWFHP